MPVIFQVFSALLAGAVVTLMVLVVSKWIEKSMFTKRCTHIIQHIGQATNTSGQQTNHVERLIRRLSRLSIPEEGWERSHIQIKLFRAGIRKKNAVIYFFAVKTLLMLILPLLLGIVLHFIYPEMAILHVLLLCLCIAAVGNYLPEMFLRFIKKKRIERMRESLPNMVDLIVVSIEAGMGLDAAILRISKEMVRTAPALAGEFYLMSREIQAGIYRVDALRNMALRSGLTEIHNLVSVLIQTETFGTSIAESFRMVSVEMRFRRTQRAKELAAKASVTMAIPLGLFVFPVLLIVFLGPAVIKLLEMLSR